MPIDDRSELDRLTRTQLYNEAAAWGIKHPPDLAKYVWGPNGQINGGMIALLESHGVGRHNTKTIKWVGLQPTEQERMAAAHQGAATSEQFYPEIPIHQSARDGVDSSALLQSKLEKAEAKNELQTDELARLKAENANLRAALSRLDEIEKKLAAPAEGYGSEVTEHVEIEKPATRRWRLIREAQAKGLKADRSTTLEELEKMLGEATH